MNKKYSLADARKSYSSDKAAEECAGDWMACYLFRPLSFYLTPALASLGVSATTVTFFSLLLLAATPASFLLPAPWHFVLLACLIAVIELLDCVDGNLARIRQQSSFRGQFADFFTDILKRLSLYLALALIVGQQFILPALAAFILALLARLIRLYIEKHSPESDMFRPASSGFWLRLLFGLEHALTLLIPLFGIYGRLDLLLWGILLYSLGDFIYSLLWAWRKTAEL